MNLPSGMVRVKLFEDENAVIQSTDRNYERIAEIIEVPQSNYSISISYTGGMVHPGNAKPEVGDTIFFDEYAYRRFTWNGEDYCIVNIDEPGALWGIIKNASTTKSEVQEAGVSPSVEDSGTTA